jgi:NADH dehydrogenase
MHVAKGLARSPIRITMIDRENHHLFQPMLYQVATAALSASDIASPIRSILRGQQNTEVLLGEVTGLSPTERRVHQWEALAPGLKSLSDAEEIRRRVLLAFERAERETDPVKRRFHLTFVIVGGGPTGVEVAGALAEIRTFALRRDFRHIDPREATVMLLEGGPRILPSYPPQLSEAAKRELRRLGVEVREDTMVTDIQPASVSAAGWTIPTETVVWAAGNVASPLTRLLGATLDRQGRVIVEPDCTVPGHPEIFVLGDAAAFNHQGGETLPGICPVAIQMGQYAARAIAGDLAGRPRRPFSYRDKGQLAVIGRGRAVADIGRFHFGGFIAWLVWIFVHIFFLIGFRNRVIVLFEWAWAYFTFQRGARLITQSWVPAAGPRIPPPR